MGMERWNSTAIRLIYESANIDRGGISCQRKNGMHDIVKPSPQLLQAVCLSFLLVPQSAIPPSHDSCTSTTKIEKHTLSRKHERSWLRRDCILISQPSASSPASAHCHPQNQTHTHRLFPFPYSLHSCHSRSPLCFPLHFPRRPHSALPER